MNAAMGNSASDKSIRAAERRRISRELHNSTSQLLVALQLQLGQLRNSPALGGAQPLLDEIAETLQAIHESIKQVDMEPVDGALDDGALDDRQVQTAKMFLSLARTIRPGR